MEDRIEHSLKELLVKHSQVVFPGFGAFKAIDIPAMIDSQNNIIYPPRRKVNYDPSVKEDDGLLVTHFARQERISRESAEEQVNQFVIDITHSLNRGKSWVVEDLGKFIVDGMNNLIFFPDPDQNFIPQSFGLPEIEIQPELITVDEEPTPIVAEKTSKKAARSKKADKKPKAERPIKEKKKGSKAILYLLLFLVTVVGGAYYYLFQTPAGKEMYAKLRGQIEENKQTATVLKKEEPSKEKTEAQSTPKEDTKPEVIKVATAQYQPRKVKVQFETPDRVDIEPTGLDQFVKVEKVAAPKEVAKEEEPKIAAKSQVKTPNQKVAAATPIGNKKLAEKKIEAKVDVKQAVKKPSTSLAETPKTKPVAKKAELPVVSKPVTKSYGNVYAKYQVVAASSMEIDIALAESEKFRKRGYNSAVLNFPDGSFKVCVGRSETADGAQAIMQKIKSELGSSLSVQQY